MKLTLNRRDSTDMALFDTALYDQNTFYNKFLEDVRHSKKRLIIESPFITSKRVSSLLPLFMQIRRRGVQIIITTRDPEEHEGIYQQQAADAVAVFQSLDILVLYNVGHHRKLAIIDGQIVWEGSLNILSFNDSCEIMRRIVSPFAVQELLAFIEIHKYLG